MLTGSSTSKTLSPEAHAVLTEERAYMNYYAPYYRSHNQFNSLYYRKEREFLVKWLINILRKRGMNPQKLSYLDCGCGNGDTLELLYQAGCSQLTGIDIAEEMLSKENQASIPGVKLVHDSIETHDFGNEKFDVILISFSIHHLYDISAFYRVVNRHLKPGGVFVISDYNADGWFNQKKAKALLNFMASPLRFLIKLKNKQFLAKQAKIDNRFNQSHRLYSFQELLHPLSDKHLYEIKTVSRGALLPCFNYALSRESHIDQILYFLLKLLDFPATLLKKGNIQAIAGYKQERSTPSQLRKRKLPPAPTTLDEVRREELAIMNHYAPAYRKLIFFNSLFYRNLRETFSKIIFRDLRKSGKTPQKLSFLDCGCGVGDDQYLLYQQGCCDLTGLDFAEEMLKTSHRAPIPGVKLIHGSIEDYDFGDKQYDVITAFLTVHHLYDPRAFFDLIEKALKPGGHFFILEYNPEAWYWKTPLKSLIDVAITPLRFLLKVKNKKALSAYETDVARFNPGHRFHSRTKLYSVLHNQGRYRLRYRTLGLFSHTLNYALVENSRLDKWISTLFAWMDLIVKPFRGGYIQILSGQKRGSS